MGPGTRWLASYPIRDSSASGRRVDHMARQQLIDRSCLLI